MKTSLTALLAPVMALWAHNALACSCAPLPSIESALGEAAFVVLADAVSIEQHPASDDPRSTTVTEHAKFRVVETLKGSKHPGDILHTRSTVGGGACGVSAKNSPVWINQWKDGRLTALPISGRWLIYALAGEGREAKPIELSLCSRSSPIEGTGEDDLKRLRRLLRDTANAPSKSAKEPAEPPTK